MSAGGDLRRVDAPEANPRDGRISVRNVQVQRVPVHDLGDGKDLIVIAGIIVLNFRASRLKRGKPARAVRDGQYAHDQNDDRRYDPAAAKAGPARPVTRRT